MPDDPKVLAEELEPTHYCVVCAARWVNHADGSWSLASKECGPCCDNVSMDTAPIVELLPGGVVNGRDAERVKGAYDSARRHEQLTRYRGILCARCDAPFEQHHDNWDCPRRVAARFKFPDTRTSPVPVQMEEAVAAEREACAKAAELRRDLFGGEPTTGNEKLIVDHIAKAIRARVSSLSGGLG